MLNEAGNTFTSLCFYGMIKSIFTYMTAMGKEQLSGIFLVFWESSSLLAVNSTQSKKASVGWSIIYTDRNYF